jgi:hypothetical protein
MAESFTNALVRAVGFVTSYTADIGANASVITGISTVGLSVGQLIDTASYLGGTKVITVGVGSIALDRQSTNSILVSSQSIRFIGLTTAYTSTGVKSILVGGTIANNTNNQVAATIQVSTPFTSYNFLYKVPVPAGSSLIISDAGKIVLNSGDEVRVGCDTQNALDVSLSILTGVS